MEIEINSAQWSFHLETVNGSEVLAATWHDNGDSDTIWTMDETTLPLVPEEAGEWLDTLNWAVGQADALDKHVIQ